ncbi:MAG: hypothetical protein ACK5NF_02340 [Bacilli bacterium]
MNESKLSQWPIQIKLISEDHESFNGKDLLIAADCCAFAYASFHQDFIAGKTTIIGCPKLDGVDYTDKLSAIFSNNDINSITVVRMEVPCCMGLAFAAKQALANSNKEIEFKEVVIKLNGEIDA